MHTKKRLNKNCIFFIEISHTVNEKKSKFQIEVRRIQETENKKGTALSGRIIKAIVFKFGRFPYVFFMYETVIL